MIDPEDREKIMEILRTRLNLNILTGSVYTGGIDGGNLYQDQRTIQLCLDNEVISEVYLD